jgi:hypothetical protein
MGTTSFASTRSPRLGQSRHGFAVGATLPEKPSILYFGDLTEYELVKSA